MNELILTVGLPKSGKTTWAIKQGHPVVNPDSIRLALHGQVYVPSMEPYVWAIALTMVESLFLVGHDVVIVDATNISEKRRKAWESDNWVCSYQLFPISASECIFRAERVNRYDLIPVIERMASDLTWPNVRRYSNETL